MIIWITHELALAIHERQLAEHGGIEGVRDNSLLDPILARPQQAAPKSSLSRSRGRAGVGVGFDLLASAASALAFGLAKNHPFSDGNKRTAHVCYRVFLALNGVELNASTEDKYVAMLSLAEGSSTEAEFADWLRKHIAPPAAAVNESKAAYR